MIEGVSSVAHLLRLSLITPGHSFGSRQPHRLKPSLNLSSKSRVEIIVMLISYILGQPHALLYSRKYGLHVASL